MRRVVSMPVVRREITCKTRDNTVALLYYNEESALKSRIWK